MRWRLCKAKEAALEQNRPPNLSHRAPNRHCIKHHSQIGQPTQDRLKKYHIAPLFINVCKTHWVLNAVDRAKSLCRNRAFALDSRRGLNRQNRWACEDGNGVVWGEECPFECFHAENPGLDMICSHFDSRIVPDKRKVNVNEMLAKTCIGAINGGGSRGDILSTQLVPSTIWFIRQMELRPSKSKGQNWYKRHPNDCWRYGTKAGSSIDLYSAKNLWAFCSMLPTTFCSAKVCSETQKCSITGTPPFISPQCMKQCVCCSLRSRGSNCGKLANL